MKKKRRIFTFVGALALVATLAYGGAQKVTERATQQQPKPEYGAIAKLLAKRLPRQHLLQRPFDETVSYGAWTNTLASYDPDRSYFTQEELKELADRAPKLCEEFRSGNVSFGYEVHKRFVRNLRARVAYAKEQLERGFDFTKHESYTWDRKGVAWPANEAERREIWRLSLKNAYLSQILSKELNATNATASNVVATVTNCAESSSAKASGGCNLSNQVVTTAAGVTNQPLGASGSYGTNGVIGATHAIPALTPEQTVIKRFTQLLTVLEDMDSETIFQRYASAFCSVYDPHSDYLSPMREEDFEMDMNLKLVGIGATLRSEDGVARIEALVPGGPASRDTRDIRLVPGDKIIAVGQDNEPPEDIVHMAIDRAVRKIRGKKGTRVVLTVIPASDPSGSTTKIVDLIRDEVKLEDAAVTGQVFSVKLSSGQSRKLGYIRVPSFYGSGARYKRNDPNFRSCALDVRKWLIQFNNERVLGVILDLRNNGGGLLPEACNMTGLFVSPGPCVLVQGATFRQALPTPEYSVACRTPLVVLINRFSASASEIVAGALQDYGRAVIIGDTQTHGKGTVQTVTDLGNDQYGALKVTTASFYRINGSSTQVRGVQADIVVPSPFDSLKEIGEGSLPNALKWTQIAPAEYEVLSDLSQQIPALRAKVSERLAQDTRYQAYSRLLRKIATYNNERTVSLERTERLEQMRAERQARKDLDAASGEGGSMVADDPQDTKKNKKDKPDIVRDVALGILSDLVDQMGPNVPVNTEPDLRARMLRIFAP